MAVTYVYAAGVRRAIPTDLWELLYGPRPTEDFRNDGCTASADCVPAPRGRVPLFAACVIHDWHYSGRAGAISRAEADRRFRINTYRVLRYYGISAVVALAVAWKRWAAVRLFGGPFYREPAKVEE